MQRFSIQQSFDVFIEQGNKSIPEETRDIKFKEIQDNLPKQRQTILELVRNNPGITSADIQKILGCGKNNFSGRLTELYNKDFKYGNIQYIEPVLDEDGIPVRINGCTSWRAIL